MTESQLFQREGKSEGLELCWKKNHNANSLMCTVHYMDCISLQTLRHLITFGLANLHESIVKWLKLYVIVTVQTHSHILPRMICCPESSLLPCLAFPSPVFECMFVCQGYNRQKWFINVMLVQAFSLWSTVLKGPKGWQYQGRVDYFLFDKCIKGNSLIY